MAHRTEASKRTFDIQIDENVDFSALMLSKNVLNGLQKYGFKRPSPVQLKAIPLGKCGIGKIMLHAAPACQLPPTQCNYPCLQGLSCV